MFLAVHIHHGRDKVLDLSDKTISGFATCPVHHREFSSERLAAWYGPYRPHATKEWWERLAEAREKYPCSAPFPAQVEDPEIDHVVRPYCPECREGFNAFLSK